MTRFRALALVLLVPIFAAADDRLSGVGAQIMSGHAREARETIVQARDAYVAIGDRANEAAAWFLLSLCDSALKDSELAHADIEHAAPEFAATGDHFGEWLSLWTMAGLETGQGHFADSIVTYERALAALRAAADPASKFSLETLKILGPVFGMQGDLLAPLASFPDALKPLLLQFAEAATRDGYAHALIESGQLDKAGEQLEKASAASASFGGIFDGSIAMHTGDLRRIQWRFDDARKSYVKALQDAKATPVPPSLPGQFLEVEILGKLAELEQLSGHLDDALAWNDRALKLVREAGNVKQANSLLEDRATLLVNGGRFTDAEKVFDEALEMATKTGNLGRQASIHSSLGALFLFEGSYGTAAKHLEKAIELYQELKEPYLEAPVWTLLAEVDMLLEANNSAADALEHAKALAKKSGFELASAMVSMLTTSNRFMAGKASSDELNDAFKAWWDTPESKSLMFNGDAQTVFRQVLMITGAPGATSPDVRPDAVQTAGPPFLRWAALMLKGKVAFERGQNEEARKYWNEALSANPSRDHRAGFLALIGASYWRDGNAAEAIDYFAKAADALDASAADVKVEELLSGYLGSNRRWYYDLLIDMLVSQGRFAEAFAQAERARARAFLQLVGNHRLRAEHGGEPALAAEAETLRTQLARWEEQRNSARAAEAEKIDADIEHGRKRYQTLLIRLKVSNPEYASVTNVEPLPLETVRESLPDGAAMISYFVSTNFVHAWVISRTGMHYASLPLDAAKLQRIVCWAKHFAPKEQQRGASREDASCGAMATDEEAFNRLVAPLLHHAGGATTLVLVPHGVLHYVPFAALRNGETGRYLVQDYTLVYTPSASALRFLHAKESPAGRRALVIGNPKTPLPLLPIPHTAEEATAVAQMFDTTAHLDKDASESLLYDLGGRFDFVHIAAHGLYDGDNPLFSRIALAPDDKKDGSLTVHEILSSVDLTGTKLVVLSACQSAVGARSGGDEVVSLTRALLYAGTPNVISTLWNINDAASEDLMTELYRRLTGGSSAAVALRQAQIHLLENPAFHDPKYWAAFTLNGDPQGWMKP